MFSNQGDIAYICDGQLAAMWVEAATKRWLHPVVLWTSQTASAAQAIMQQWGTSIVSENGETMDEKYTNTQKLDELIAAVKSGAPIAFDWENVPSKALQYLESKWLLLKPGWEVLQTTQHRGREKEAINNIHGSSVTAEYEEVLDFEEAKKAFEKLWPWRLKTCTGWYDGKWQWPINNIEELVVAFKEMWDNIPELVYEKNVDFVKEVSVILWRNQEGEFAWYDPFLNHHEWGIIRTTEVGDIWVYREIRESMIDFTKQVAEWLGVEWIMCMEMFLEKDGKFRANEIAARAHNSGHITRSTHDTSQFDLQIMAMLNEKMPGYIPLERPGRMVNIIGDDVKKYQREDFWRWWTSDYITSHPNFDETQIISYGKWEAKAGRKMWHEERI